MSSLHSDQQHRQPTFRKSRVRTKRVVVEKIRTNLEPDTPPASRVNTLLMGTNVVSGTAIAVVVHTGPQTEFGKVSDRLRLRPPETGFERGVRQFGYFLMEITMILVIAIFAINVLLGRPTLQSLLFSLAIAVGLTPQLLPAIVSVNLAHGSRNMAHQKVIVKRLASIENFGSMNVLCSDKTGTLTEGHVQLRSAINVDGNDSGKALLYAYLNAFYSFSLFTLRRYLSRLYLPLSLWVFSLPKIISLILYPVCFCQRSRRAFKPPFWRRSTECRRDESTRWHLA